MLIRGMFMESSFKPKAKSGDNAQGIAQFTPIAIKDMKQMGFVDDDFDPYDVNQARDAQEKFMNYFITRNEGTDEVRLAKAAAAYNYGQTNLNNYLAKQVAKGVDTMNTLDWVDGLNDETKDYVRAVVLNDLGDRADEYEKRRPIYFETYPDVQDERQATPREDVAPMESKDPPRQISPELQEALDILVRDQKNYEHGGRHDEGPTGAERPNYRTDSFNAPIDSDPSYLNEKIERARKTGTGLKTRARPQGEDQNPFEYTELNPVYTMTDPSAVKTANEYYKAAYSDPSVIEILNNFFDQSGPNRTSPSNSAGTRDDFPEQMENLRALYPNATDATLGDLLARRSRDIMSSTSDYVLLEDRASDWGSVSDKFYGDGTKGGTDAGSRDNPIWMGLGDVQRRGGRKVQIDLLPESGDRQSVTTHEMSHAQDRSGRYIPPAMVDYMTNLRLDRSEAKSNDGEAMTKRRYDYLSQPTETRARLQDLRQKVFDLRGGEFSREVDRETFDKLKSEMAYNDLVGLYGEEGVFNLINNVYEHGGRHDDPPNYSLGQQVLDYLAGYGQARPQKDNRFDATLQDMTDFFMSRQGQDLSTEPNTRYERGIGTVPSPSDREEALDILNSIMVTNDKSEAQKYTTLTGLAKEDQDDDPEYRSFMTPGVVDKETGERLTREEYHRRQSEPETRFTTKYSPIVYNYLSENPSARASTAEEFYHGLQAAANKAQGRSGDLGLGYGSSRALNELMDMNYYGASGEKALLGREDNRTFDAPTLYQANEPMKSGDRAFYDRVHSQNIGDPARVNLRWYYMMDDKAEGDAALNSGIYFARKMGILPEGEITAQDLPEVLERFKGYTATQSGGTEFDSEKLLDWKPDGRKIAKMGKDGEVTLTKYGKKWIQDDNNKLRFRERTMTQGDSREARLDNNYMRILEDIISDAVNQRGLFNPDNMNPDIARQGYERSLNSTYTKDYERRNNMHPGNQFSSGKMPIDLLLEVINTGGSYSKSSRERGAEMDLLNDERRAREEYDYEMNRIYGQQ